MQNPIPPILIYNKFCPYAQRALLTAIEKQIQPKFRAVSLKDDKEPFFVQTYAKAIGRDPLSKAKVPILIHGNTVLAESELVCWYISQKFDTGSQLIPSDLIDRAKMRLWITRWGGAIISLFQKAKFRQFNDPEELKQQAITFLNDFDAAIVGPFLLGPEISLADLMIYPWFERWVILEHYFGVEANVSSRSRIQKWLQTLNARPSIVQTRSMTTTDYYIQRSQKMMTAKL